MNSKFINTVCFMRSYEYSGKDATQYNLTALNGQMDMYNRFNLPATYLMEYDTLIKEDFRNALNAKRKPEDEIGVWFEITGELARDAGVEWRGKRNRNWDFYVCPGFSPSYSYDEKVKIIKTLMENFKGYFGFYPRTIGSWIIDTETMKIFTDNYEIDAFSVCREQWGMDGYTLWGGPHYGAYYPTLNNMQTPAQKLENQINAPVFRMYSNDPIYCYYEFGFREFNDVDYGLFTTEPVWLCGQSMAWVHYQYENTFGNDNDSFNYLQLGQETCFGWAEPLPSALEMQCEFAVKNQEKYGYKFTTVSDMGKAFKESYKTTPDNRRYTLNDWMRKGHRSYWFNNKKYRLNLFSKHDQNVWIRDIHFFSDNYKDRYLDEPSRKEWAVYDNPPVMDGVRFTYGCDEKDIPFQNDFRGRKYGDRAGMYFGEGYIESVNPDYSVNIAMKDGRKIVAKTLEDAIEFSCDKDFELNFVFKEHQDYIEKINPDSIEYNHMGFKYAMVLKEGSIDGKIIKSSNGKLVMTFEER